MTSDNPENKLLFLLREEEPTTFPGWRGIAFGIAVVTIIFVAIKLMACYRRRPRNRTRSTIRSNLRTTNSPETAQQGPFRTPDPTQPSLTVPSHVVHVNGRTLYLSPDGQAPNWSQYRYQHNHNDRHSIIARSADGRPIPRFNPDDLLSFEATGEDRKNPCPICLGLLDEEPVSTGQCLHLMHTSCLKSWLAKDVKSACPVCRVSYLSSVPGESESSGSVENHEHVNVPQSVAHTTSLAAASSLASAS